MDITNRPIEFIVWDTKTQKYREDITIIEAWIDSDSFDDPEELFQDPYHWLVVPTYNNRLIWCQYAGFNDKDNEKIYEWDVLQALSSVNPPNFYTGYVVFINGMFQLASNQSFGSVSYKPLATIIGDHCKKIGNVFEDKDLL